MPPQSRPESRPLLGVIAGRIRSVAEKDRESVADVLTRVRDSVETDKLRTVLVVTIDADGSIDVLSGGGVDPVEMIGALEVAKHDFMAML